MRKLYFRDIVGTSGPWAMSLTKEIISTINMHWLSYGDTSTLMKQNYMPPFSGGGGHKNQYPPYDKRMVL